MSTTISTLPQASALAVLASVANGGEQASRRYLELFGAHGRNPNTRAAYARAASGFFAWRGRHGLVVRA